MEITETKERLGFNELGVYEETAPLKKVLMWGAPGAECALAQLLPENISCFYQQFDVMKARAEFDGAVDSLQKASPSTEIILVKDLFAQMVDKKNLKSNLDLDSLVAKLGIRADDLYDAYGIGNLKEIKEWMLLSVMADVNKYGEDTAVYMNEVLANFNGLPMANILYARDQSNLIGKTWIWSSMKHEIRQPEVALYKEIILASGIIGDDITQIQVDGDGKFEGGDGIPSDGIAYIGVGGRTNLDGVMQVAPYILKDNLRLIVVYDERRDLKKDPEMDAMHYDTIGMPSSLDEIVACPEELERRRAIEIINVNGKLETKDLGSFDEFLARREAEVIEVTKEEQKKHAPNFVNLGDKRVILSLTNKNLVTKLRDKGYHVHSARLTETTKGYGGLHCMSAPIKRG